ncbi:MAG: D-sedoheptulose 7-phosphate isomerase [Nitrospinae bacterium]|nr:D-sedoheptulose 7-phosphate isomerase [Nitrospinota bacterium]
MKNSIKKTFERSIAVKQMALETLVDPIAEAATAMASCLREGKKIVLMGNGGSAADAQHIAAEFVGRFLKERRPLPAIALTTDASILTAIGNDYGFEKVFERQVEALVREGDVVIGISTSGNSENVLAALKKSRELGARTIALLGCGGGKIALEADIPITVPSSETPRIQETHITIGHILCEEAERNA